MSGNHTAINCKSNISATFIGKSANDSKTLAHSFSQRLIYGSE